MFGLGPTEMMIFGAIAVMLFGSKLPELARNLGGSYREFRKGLSEIQSQMSTTANWDSKPLPRTVRDDYDRDDYDDYAAPSAPRFEPPAAAPQEDSRA